MSRIVIALGGNALGKTPGEQLSLLSNVAKIIVELYTSKDDHTSETKLEKWMSENGLGWKKPNRAWDTTNKLCVTYYNLSVVFEN